MGKNITLDKVKTLLEPILHIIGKKAERPSWDENDPGSASYIAGRTHYTETVQVEDLPETVLEFASTYSTAAPAYLMAQIEKTLDIAVGDTRTVVWDGMEYVCKAKEFNGLTVLGNTSILEIGADTGEPFIMAVFPAGNGGGVEIVTLDTSPTHTVRIYGEKTVTHRIPSKYLPDMSYVSYKNEQGLTDEQMALARWNIGAGTSDFNGDYLNLRNRPTVYTDVIRYSAQNLSDNQKSIARNNIGATSFDGKYASLSGKPDSVLFSSQSLSTAQKMQARENIGAGTSDFSGSYNSLQNIPVIDWNAQSGYGRIENRICYDDMIKTWLFNSVSQVDALSYPGGIIYYYGKTLEEGLVAGRWYHVIFNNNSYYLQAREVVGRLEDSLATSPKVCLGNASILRISQSSWIWDVEDTEEPFVFITSSAGRVSLEATESFAASLYYETQNLKQLDEKFIPDTIQRAGGDVIIPSSTEGSTKKFKITVDDSGTLTATEVT